MTKQDVGGRWNRWLYHGLHSLDCPFLYNRRPLWDIVLIVLSAGGLVLSATTLVPSWRRPARHARRVRFPIPQRGVRETLGAGLRSPAGPTQSST